MPSDESEHEAIQPYHVRAASAPHPSSASEGEQALPSIARERLTTFFDQEVRVPRPWPIFAVMLLLLAVGAGVLSAVIPSLELFLGGCLGLFTFGLVLWLTRPPALVLRFSEEGITFTPAKFFLPYRGIQRIFTPERKDAHRFRILLLCAGGHLVLPKKLGVDSEDLYQFLRSQPLGPNTIPDEVDPAFRNFLRQHLALHGLEEMTIYQRPEWTERQTIKTSWRHNGYTRTALALLAASIAWFVAFGPVFSRPSFAFLPVIGMVALIASGVIFLIGLLQGIQLGGNKKLRKAMLIVSPSGLALAQGDLKGELRWSEIQKIKYAKSAHAISGSLPQPGVLIHVKGAVITIADIYQWPAEHIELLIREYAGV